MYAVGGGGGGVEKVGRVTVNTTLFVFALGWIIFLAYSSFNNII